jgi:hypothetical protein
LLKSLYYGLGSVVLLVVGSMIYKDWNILLVSCGTVGLLSILLGGLVTGAFQQRDVFAENYPQEDKKLRDLKTRWSTKLLVFGLPNIIASIISYIFLN